MKAVIRDFSETRRMFDLPPGITYLDGNSLGPVPHEAARRVERTVRHEWGDLLIRGWTEGGWMTQPKRVGDRIARLIGAAPGTVVLGETLSIKVFQALSAALDLRPDRRVVLSDTGNFPGDLYIAQGLLDRLGRGHALRCVAPEAVAEAIDDDVAVVLLTQADYRTGRLHDMEALTQRAHAAGALALWDLAHSAGALPVSVAATGADMAYGCTYKYLNGGPGAPAFIYLSPDIAAQAHPILAGWLGHEAPFAFDPTYRPGAGVDRMRVGTPPVIALAALEASLDIWERVDIHDVRAASIELSTRFIEGVESRCPDLKLASPRDPHRRGSQVSFAFEHSQAAMQALIARGVIGDFRTPDLMRFGFAPLYVSRADIDRAVDTLAEVMEKRLWEHPSP